LVDQWLDWTNNNYRPFQQIVLRPPLFNEKHHPDTEVHNYFVGSGRKKLDAAFDLVDRHLAKTGNSFLVGSSVTLADICLNVQILMLTYILDEKELIQPEKRPHFGAWFERIPKSTPHWGEINAAFYAARDEAKKAK